MAWRLERFLADLVHLGRRAGEAGVCMTVRRNDLKER